LLSSGNAKKSAAYGAIDFATDDHSAIFAQSLIAYPAYRYSFFFRVKATFHQSFTSLSDLLISICLMTMDVEEAEAVGAAEEGTRVFAVKPEK
jgi:hypothetical protein